MEAGLVVVVFRIDMCVSNYQPLRRLLTILLCFVHNALSRLIVLLTTPLGLKRGKKKWRRKLPIYGVGHYDTVVRTTTPTMQTSSRRRAQAA